MRKVRDDLLDARLTSCRIADQDLLPAGLFDLGGKRPLKRDCADELVLLVVVRFLVVLESFNEIVVQKRGAENVIAFGKVNPELRVRERIEINQLRGFVSTSMV